MKYGLPYKGSKNAIASWIVDQLPCAPVLVDAFACGCAVTHAALLSGKYSRVIANDLTNAPDLFWRALNGEITLENMRYICREDFHKLNQTDALVRLAWSFGNDGKSYLFGKDREEEKHLLFSLLTKPSINERKLSLIKFLRLISKKKSIIRAGEHEAIDRINRIQKIENSKAILDKCKLFVNCCDYRQLEYPKDSIIYCDIPYKGASGYGGAFNHNDFYEWASTQKQQVFISEYSMPPDRFICIAERERTEHINKNDVKKVERLFIPKKQK